MKLNASAKAIILIVPSALKQLFKNKIATFSVFDVAAAIKKKGRKFCRICT
jgi:hypothetical protein